MLNILGLSTVGQSCKLHGTPAWKFSTIKSLVAADEIFLQKLYRLKKLF